MNDLAEEARQATAAAERRIAAKQVADAKAAKNANAKLQIDMAARAALDIFPEAQAQIAKAAAKGKHSVLIEIMRWNNEPAPAWANHLARSTSALLQAAGFKVTTRPSKMEPFGSDSMFERTVYDLDLQVDW